MTAENKRKEIDPTQIRYRADYCLFNIYIVLDGKWQKK